MPQTTTSRGPARAASKASAKTSSKPDAPDASLGRVIKKYPNRRLYDTQTSAYITLAEVKRMVLDAETFTVVDAKTGENLTRSILLQIILEEESGGMPMFSSEMLSQIIRFYGHAMQGFMGSYLEKNVQAFIDLQQRMSEHSKGFTPEMWQQFMSMQSPLMQGVMGNYVEQSKTMFVQMQEQMQKQTEQMLGAFGMSGVPGMPGTKK